MLDFIRDTGAGITDTNYRPVVLLTGVDANGTFLRRVLFVCVCDGMGRIDDQVEDNLIELGSEAGHKR